MITGPLLHKLSPRQLFAHPLMVKPPSAHDGYNSLIRFPS